MLELRLLSLICYLAKELMLLELNLQEFLQQHKQIIEDFLVRLLPHQTSQSLYAAMQYSVLNNGKRLRPALVYATGKVLETPIDKLNAAAAAVELVHCYSLVHDDLPAMDDDDLRRGMPSCHKAFGEATAILTGDALQSMAFEVLSDPELNPLAVSLQIEMIQVLSKAIGSRGMVLGQAQDMAAENQAINLESLIQLHKYKTGCLFNACIELALIASEQNNKAVVREALLDYGTNIGLAFQIQDDILDATSDDITLGKPAGSDIAAGKSTFITLLGVDGAREYAALALQQAIDALSPLGYKANILSDLAMHLINRTS
jgi:geranylgeranyl pyrophosphate synthase